MSTINMRWTVAITAAILAVAISLSLVFAVSKAVAYEGAFCSGIYLDVYAGCSSGTESNIRRAIGHGKDYSYVEINGDGLENTSSCYSDGCGADTGYLARDITGSGGIENAGDPCGCGGGDYYAYLYP